LVHPCRREDSPRIFGKLGTNETSILRHLDYLDREPHLPVVGPVTEGSPLRALEASAATTRAGGCGIY
jgi:hypothetical protein